MKQTFVRIALLGLMLISLTYAYADQKSIAGNWNFGVRGAASDSTKPEMVVRLVLQQKGKTITGTLQNPHGNPIQIKGQFSKGRFTFTGSSEGGEWAYRLSGTGTLQSDGSFSGDIKSNVGDLLWTAVRAQKPE